MAQMVAIDLRPSDKTLAQFGWIALVGFGVLALLAFNQWLVFAFVAESWRVGLAVAFAAVGVLAALLSLVFPRGNWPLYVGLTLLAFPIGFVLSYVIMGLLFYVMLAPLGIFFRLTGKDLLQRRFETDRESYWVDARPPRPKESYFRQF